MFAIKAIYDGKDFKAMEPIPVDSEYEVIITFTSPMEKTATVEKARQFPRKRFVFAVIMFAILMGIGALIAISLNQGLTPVINTPILDETVLDRIVMRINQEGVETTVNSAGIIQVQGEDTARRMRGILIREDLIPAGTDPWVIFDRDRWSITDFERNINLRRAIERTITDHIKALDHIDDISVHIAWPQNNIFSEQNPMSASVIITPVVGSDIVYNHTKIEGIIRILQYAIEGLTLDNIVIVDNFGHILNDF